MKKIILIAIVIVMAGCSVSFAQYVAQDPTRNIPNARVLGLGKAYTALADDTGSIYTNPAGLNDATGWQICSMSGKLLDEFSYLSFSGFYPAEWGTLGFGFAGTSVSGAYATTVEVGSDPADPIYVIDPSQPLMGNYNNAFVLSYANQGKKLPGINKLPYMDSLSFGTSLKIFRSSVYGDGIINGNAAGYELDLGMKAYPQKWLKLGVAVQNLLPSTMGGKLKYESGHEEAYPAVIEMGSAFKILGKENAIRSLGDHELSFMLDCDLHPTLSGYPAILHMGVEWNPISILAVRAGIDQDTSGDGAGGLTTVSDQSYGIGLNMSGFKFDYAFHTFAGAPNISNNYFSLSYAFQPPVVVVSTTPAEAIIVTNPSDKLITYESSTLLTGKIADQRIRKFFINGNSERFTLAGEFSKNMDLKEGKNSIVIEGKNESLTQGWSKKIRALRLTRFPDVTDGAFAEVPISVLGMAGVISGYPDGSFRPGGSITRAEMCSLIIKTMPSSEEAKPSQSKIFKDVALKNWAANYIAEAVRLGYVKGYPKNVFKPNNKISRAEGVVIISRFAGFPEEVYMNEFGDLSADHWASGYVAGMYPSGVLDYLKGKLFEPNKLLTRAEVAEMLYKTSNVQYMLKNSLLDWETY
ncbi:MAG: S-layer homology domain-containing protein [Candidatus Margulisiibacteriota bacterium]